MEQGQHNRLFRRLFGYIGIISEKSAEKAVVLTLLQIAKRISKMPKFKLYALADGIYTVLAKSKTGIDKLIRKKPWDRQLSLFPMLGFAAA